MLLTDASFYFCALAIFISFYLARTALGQTIVLAVGSFAIYAIEGWRFLAMLCIFWLLTSICAFVRAADEGLKQAIRTALPDVEYIVPGDEIPMHRFEDPHLVDASGVLLFSHLMERAGLPERNHPVTSFPKLRQPHRTGKSHNATHTQIPGHEAPLYAKFPTGTTSCLLSSENKCG
jgi:hypothetical protein